MSYDLSKLFDNWEDRPEDALVPEEEESIRQPTEVREVLVAELLGRKDAQNPRAFPSDLLVVLRDHQGREVPIKIGPFEAMAISNAMNNIPVERPLTHDLLQATIERLGAQLEQVVIDDLHDQTFYARLILTPPKSQGPSANNAAIEIDARSSDAIALALRARVPIYMAEDILAAIAEDDD
jgi:uncharacterized protein